MGLSPTIDVHCPVNPEVVCSYRQTWAELYAHPQTTPDQPIVLGQAFEHDDRVLSIKGMEHTLATKRLGCDALDGENVCPVAEQMRDSKTRSGLRDLFRTIVEVIKK